MTSKTHATAYQPHTIDGAHEPLQSPASAIEATNSQNAFVGMVLTMSWQLAVAVIIPIIGGHYFDVRLHSSPWFVLAGVLLAGAAFMAVMVRTVGQANVYASSSQKSGDTK